MAGTKCLDFVVVSVLGFRDEGCVGYHVGRQDVGDDWARYPPSGVHNKNILVVSMG